MKVSSLARAVPVSWMCTGSDGISCTKLLFILFFFSFFFFFYLPPLFFFLYF